MKRLRPVYVTKTKTLSDSETVTLDIKGSDPISALEIVYQATNGATSNQGVRLHGDVDSIVLEDGSDTIFNLTGIEAQALNFYETGKLPPRTLTEAAAGVQKERFFIHFGRYLGDEEYHLTPENFSNLQLKCEHSITISATAGFATGTGRLSVIAHTFDEPVMSSRGFMMSKRKKSFTSAASGEEEVTLPSDYPIRLALLRAFESGVGVHESITDVKITCDNDKYVPLDMTVASLKSLNEQYHGLAEAYYDLLRTDGDTVLTEIGEIKECFVNAVNDLDVAGIDGINDDIVTLQLLSLTATPTIAKSSTDTKLSLVVRALAPFNTLNMLPMDLNDPSAWFDASRWSEVKAVLTQGNADAACAVLTQQARGY